MQPCLALLSGVYMWIDLECGIWEGIVLRFQGETLSVQVTRD